jgi:DNA-binding response OmpR family regulator
MRVLVVEDNKKFSKFLVRALQEEGYEVELAEDGDAALGRASAAPFDLVLLDWMLPGQDGLAVCRALRARGVTTPILMLTARAEVSERIEGLDAGADDYLSKPFDLGELLARCRALSRRGAPAVAPLRVGPLVIDRANRRALLDDQRIEMTPREFSLLAHLAREPGRVAPRMEILSKVWEMSVDPGSNLIEVHVKNLREKLGEHARMIETVRGVGYRLVPPG